MTQHTHFSSYREKLIEHLFLGELLKLSWLKYKCSLEIARPEVDNSGYDAIAEAKGIVRHIQIKTSVVGGKTANQKVHLKLASKPSACVLWIYFNEKSNATRPVLVLRRIGTWQANGKSCRSQDGQAHQGEQRRVQSRAGELARLAQGRFQQLLVCRRSL